ncbi:hypothetical protein SAMN04487949_0971 [Halogranum gelatinilyticum]|uniref:Uncharacterized protein n=1 Tax=Halogranum gelatinilyticum TaxID=660521 RepID=A0A1G9QPY5_9EURY|nr:hypothetical protein [Halogranum gelatinilyticum]SDM13043.1 hypothetical protein SAMN04487949_0971 [Halogranum gelatinilyticum]
MEFDLQKTVLLFTIPLLVIIGGTVTSPMPQPISIGVSVGIALFGVLALVVGIKHGEFRATH